MTSTNVTDMKRWKKLLLGLPVFLVVLVSAGWLLPSTARVERSVLVRGQPQDVFSLVASLKRWPEWTAWTTNRFPDLTMRFEGPDTGVGATMTAAGKSSGDGTVKITAAEPANGITYSLDFDHGKQLFGGMIRYTNTPDGLRVTWTLDASLGGNPLKRWAGLAMGTLMGGDMDHGLANLKLKLEARP